MGTKCAVGPLGLALCVVLAEQCWPSTLLALPFLDALMLMVYVTYYVLLAIVYGIVWCVDQCTPCCNVHSCSDAGTARVVGAILFRAV